MSKEWNFHEIRAEAKRAYQEQFPFEPVTPAWTWHIWKMAFHRGFERCRIELQEDKRSVATKPNQGDDAGDTNLLNPDNQI